MSAVPPDKCSRITCNVALLCRGFTYTCRPLPQTSILDREQYALGVTDLISRFYPQLGSQQRLALREVLVDVMSETTVSRRLDSKSWESAWNNTTVKRDDERTD